MAPRLAACGLALAAFVLIAGGLVFDQIAAVKDVSGSGSWWLYPFLLAAVVAPAVVGALIVVQRPGNPIGWILVLGALSLAAVLGAQPYAWAALDAHPESLSGGSWAALVSSLWPVFFAWPLAIALVFPDGRLPSRRWRPYALFAAFSIALLVVLLVLSAKLESPFEDVANPFPARWPDALGFLRGPVWLAVFGSLVVGVAAARSRYRGSEGIERLQMRWLSWAALLIPAGVVCFLAWGFVLGNPGDAVLAVVLTSQVAVALAVGVAVTRYRLYDIDRLINRTLVYSAVTASLGVLFAAISLLAGVVVGRGSTWVAALAAVLAVCAFGPLRRRAQAAVDWRFDRPRYDGLRRVRAFVDDVREGRREPERIGAVLAAALRDPGAELLFRLPESGAYADDVSVVGDPPFDGRAVTRVEHRGQEIALLLHAPALLYRPDLLRSVLTEASLAIEIARLRVEVRIQLAEVEESRSRVVQAGYEERRRLERDLHDGAQQRLVTLGIVLRRLELSVASGGGFGYLLKERVLDVDDFLDAARRVCDGGSALDPEVVATLLAPRRRENALGDLTPREHEVLALMAEGRTNVAIAKRLWLTERTVETHVRSILGKLGLPTSGDDHRRVLAVLTYLRADAA